MIHPTLFDEPYAGMPGFQRTSATSKAAAISVADTAATKRARILECIAESWNGRTADEVAQLFGDETSYSTAPRIRELVLMGKLIATEATRETRRGRQATVYEAPR